jgi:hypothetical protein
MRAGGLVSAEVEEGTGAGDSSPHPRRAGGSTEEASREPLSSAPAQGMPCAAPCSDARVDNSVAEPQRTGRTRRATLHGAA